MLINQKMDNSSNKEFPISLPFFSIFLLIIKNKPEKSLLIMSSKFSLVNWTKTQSPFAITVAVLVFSLLSNAFSPNE